ncbi:unnamed protein product [Orchesella dallaii]|uniref:F-box domain-containing protein n=1 Tax=Orchesella dallaii TaxID=48710 RepID=A0ABP1RIW0_9HEXA
MSETSEGANVPAKHPLEILPPEDRTSCSKASITFNEILSLEKTTFLFPEVLPLLAAKNIPPFNFLPKHSKCDIRNLRLVCRTWRTAIDNYIQHHPCHFQVEEASPTTPINHHHGLKIKSATTFSHPEYLSSFHREVSSYTGENPFLSRHVILTDVNRGNVQNSNRLWSEFETLLSLWGSQIWYFEVVILSDHFFFQIYTNIEECLALMPNLKVLVLKSMEPMASRELEVDWLSDLVLVRPLTRLEHLEVFSARLLPTPVMNEALTKFSNVRCLQIDKDNGLRHEYYSYDAENLHLPNLKELSLPLITVNDLRTLEKVTWPLETLTLVVSCKEVQVDDGQGDLYLGLDITDILSCVFNKFGERLKNFTIKLNGHNRWKAPIIQCANISLNLNMTPLLLEKLFVRMKCVQMKNIDFVLNFKELKQLSVILDSYQVDPSLRREKWLQLQKEGEVDAILKFFSYMEHMSMYESNLWELLPNLETLEIKLKANLRLSSKFTEHRFIREEYELFQLINQERKSEF